MELEDVLYGSTRRARMTRAVYGCIKIIYVETKPKIPILNPQSLMS
jgi:hypothetical protein